MRSLVRLSAALLIAGATVVAGAQQRQINEGGRVDADVNVEINNLVGSVTVTAWDRDEIEVRGTLGEGAQGVSFENDRDDVEIDVEISRRSRRNLEDNVAGTDLEVRVPAGASVQIESLAANIVVEGVNGDVQVETSAGSVTYAGASPDIEADTAAGDIEVTTTAGRARIDVEAVAGSVTVEFVAGAVDAGTLTGHVRVIGGRLDEGDFESVSGDLYFEGEIGPNADASFENFDGSIDLIIPEDTSAEFDISTYSGSIETEFGYEGVPAGEYSPEMEAAFTLGSGGAEVSIETFSGQVQIRRR